MSDLLLSFTAAFEHMPSHRRLKLFSELARTLGPEDSLSAIIALLADRHQSNKTHRKFSTELLLAFDPEHTLHVGFPVTIALLSANRIGHQRISGPRCRRCRT